MKISLYGPANLPKYWKNLYESLCKNDISFEIVFAGPNKPDFKLPSNFKFIQTNVKPAQCAEIAYRNTEGEYVMITADDLIFDKYLLDKLYKTFIDEKNDLLAVSPLFNTLGKKLSKDYFYLIFGNDGTPLLPICGFYKKSVFDSLGKIDSNFIGTRFESDMALRLYGIGGKIIFTDDYVTEFDISLNKKKLKKRLCAHVGKIDRKYLKSCWIEKKFIKEKGKMVKVRKIFKTRLKPVIPFIDKDILIKSQGNNIKEYWN